jgi:hypothetical protein
MNIRDRTVSRLACCLMQSPQHFRSVLRNLPSIVAGQMYAAGYEEHGAHRSDVGKAGAR